MLLIKRLLLAALFVVAGSSVAMGHDYWVWGEAGKPGQKMTVDVGFGHDFPNPEELPDFFVKNALPTKVLGAKGELALEPDKEDNYRSLSKAGVAKGSYVILAGSKPRPRTKGADGFEAKYKNEVQGAVDCTEMHMSAKSFVNVGVSDLDFIKKPQGQPLEVIPQADPGAVKPGQVLPLLVLYDGKPLAWADISATFGGFASDDPNAKAFVSKTNRDGIVNVIPLAPGIWKVAVNHKAPHPDSRLCDQSVYNTYYTFSVK